MRKVLKIATTVLASLVLVACAAYGWAAWTSSGLLSRTVETHRVEFPIPYPLSEGDLAALQPGAEAGQIALARALERGKHLVESRYACGECHGADFGGGVMVDDPMIGRLLAPNLTAGRGSVTATYHAADWDRAVRHGVAPDGRPTAMPAEDFQRMSDQELSDVVAYVRSVPAVDNEVPEVRLGPLGKVLVALGQIPVSADHIAHDQAHAVTPPFAEANAEFGAHLAGVCTGCHGPDLAGGRIAGGDPSWPPARNLTPHPAALGPWTYANFVTAMTEGKRPDGTALQAPMSAVLPYARNMTEVERQALWAYVQSMPVVAP